MSGGGGNGAFGGGVGHKGAHKYQFCTPLQFIQATRGADGTVSAGSAGFVDNLSPAERVVNSYVQMLSRRFYAADDLGIGSIHNNANNDSTNANDNNNNNNNRSSSAADRLRVRGSECVLVEFGGSV